MCLSQGNVGLFRNTQDVGLPQGNVGLPFGNEGLYKQPKSDDHIQPKSDDHKDVVDDFGKKGWNQ